MRVYQTKDPELVAKLNEPVHQLHVERYPELFKPYDFEEVKNFFSGIIDHENFVFLIVEDTEFAVGYLWFEYRDYHETVFTKSYRSIYVHQISVNPSKRSKGLGARLMEEAAVIAKGQNINRIELDYWAKNEKARDFYRKLNFEVSREYVYKEI